MNARFFAARRASDLVFATIDGNPMSPDNLSRDWIRISRQKGLPKVSFHALRHSHASALIASGLDVLTVSRRLGHGSPVGTLNTYSQLFAKRTAPRRPPSIGY